LLLLLLPMLLAWSLLLAIYAACGQLISGCASAAAELCTRLNPFLMSPHRRGKYFCAN